MSLRLFNLRQAWLKVRLLQGLQEEMTNLTDEVQRQRGVVKDGDAAMERCEELEEKLMLLNTELVRAQTQLRRANQKATECEKKLSEGERTLKSTQRALAAAEERASSNGAQVRAERAAREAAESGESDANSRRAQVRQQQQQQYHIARFQTERNEDAGKRFIKRAR